jgi:hypothetical protein
MPQSKPVTDSVSIRANEKNGQRAYEGWLIHNLGEGDVLLGKNLYTTERALSFLSPMLLAILFLMISSEDISSVN